MTIESLADEVGELIQDQLWEPALVVGLSMGGCVALPGGREAPRPGARPRASRHD
jgi:surfactin synthase thioesterase subunit